MSPSHIPLIGHLTWTAIVVRLLLFSSTTILVRDVYGQDRSNSLHEIRGTVVHVHDMVKSLEVVYVQAVETLSPNAKNYYRFRLLAKDRLRTRETTHWSTNRSERVDLNHMTQFLTRDSFDYFVHHSRYYEKSQSAYSTPSTWKLRDDTYLRLCGWWPANEERSSAVDSELAVHLRFALDNPHYQLCPGREYVDGHRCVVVEVPGVDRLWLDPDLGYAIRKRELKDRDGRVWNRFVVQSHKKCEVADDNNRRSLLWMPTRVLMDHKADSRRGTASELVQSEITVERLLINSIDESRFSFTPPPGTLVYDRDRNLTQQIPGGRDLINANIAIEQELTSKGKPTSGNPALQSRALLLISVCTLVLANLYFVFMKR